jgi:hypothetical protein
MAENGVGIDVCDKVDGCTLFMTWVCSVCQGAHAWYLERGDMASDKDIMTRMRWNMSKRVFKNSGFIGY